MKSKYDYLFNYRNSKKFVTISKINFPLNYIIFYVNIYFLKY